jgi:CXXX repeat peptide maturase
MHNCEAGIGNITIAPNGKFYLCPAFYYDEKTGVSNKMNHKTKDASRSVGDLENGLCIPNKQLLELDHAPLCRNCDAYHCNRCIWLNQKLTWDNNTPSHQQCVIAHLERNAARDISAKLSKAGYNLPEIKEINYIDPFDVKEEW